MVPEWDVASRFYILQEFAEHGNFFSVKLMTQLLVEAKNKNAELGIEAFKTAKKFKSSLDSVSFFFL